MHENVFTQMNTKDFKIFIENNKNKIYRFALSITKDPSTAQDVAQEVFIKIWKQIQDSEIENMGAWAMRLTRNLSIDKTRLKARSFDSLHLVHGYSSNENTPDQIVEEKDAVAQVKQFMEELPPKQRNILHLREVEEMSYDEISQILEVPLEQVKVYLFRARKAIRQKFLKIDAYGI